jgi:hypothetical protein
VRALPLRRAASHKIEERFMQNRLREDNSRARCSDRALPNQERSGACEAKGEGRQRAMTASLERGSKVVEVLEEGAAARTAGRRKLNVFARWAIQFGSGGASPRGLVGRAQLQHRVQLFCLFTSCQIQSRISGGSSKCSCAYAVAALIAARHRSTSTVVGMSGRFTLWSAARAR